MNNQHENRVNSLFKISNECYRYIYKTIMTLSTLALGGTMLSNAQETMNKSFLCFSWLFFIVAIILVSIALYVVYIVSAKSAQNILKDSNYDSSTANLYSRRMTLSALISTFIAIVLILLAAAYGKNERPQKEPTYENIPSTSREHSSKQAPTKIIKYLEIRC